MCEVKTRQDAIQETGKLFDHLVGRYEAEFLKGFVVDQNHRSLSERALSKAVALGDMRLIVIGAVRLQAVNNRIGKEDHHG